MIENKKSADTSGYQRQKLHYLYYCIQTFLNLISIVYILIICMPHFHYPDQFNYLALSTCHYAENSKNEYK